MPAGADMVSLLLLSLLWGGSLQEDWEYQLRVQDTVTVQEGLCVHVPCSFSYPWSSWSTRERPYMYWLRSGDSSHNSQLVATNDPTKTVKTEFGDRFNLVRKPQENDCSLRIREARRSDQGLYKFQIGKDYGRYTYRDKQLNLQVAALTQEPDIHFLEPLKSGYPTNLTCSLRGSCEEGRPLSFFWMGGALDSLDPQTLRSSVLTLTPRVQDHGSNLTCQVHLPGVQGTVERTIRLNVSYAPQNLTISFLSGDVTALKFLEKDWTILTQEGQIPRLLCVAEGNPPAQLSWVLGGQTLSSSQPADPGILELPQIQLEHEGDLTCQAQNALGSQHISLHLSVVYPPRLLSPSCSWEGEGLHCNCSSRAQPAPILHWRLGEELLEGNHSNASWTVTSSLAGPWANSSLSLSGPLGSGLRLSCEARNDHGKQSAAVLLLPGKPVLLAGAVPAALGGAGAMALLSLSLCLLFFCVVKARRKQASGSREGLDDEDPVMGTVAWSPDGHSSLGPAVVQLHWLSHGLHTHLLPYDLEPLHVQFLQTPVPVSTRPPLVIAIPAPVPTPSAQGSFCHPPP
ncbi:sialic acid-binding Ig-like lectin 5 isoform X1 [Mustela erminea]|uniref:sialic acid-binding Ig-like lectin 5 isoform X1 n=1 Tax=Mustela erminea TaxID=36723 RepID=UPI0013870CB8|nr:sialic acid-binding Ig-like lectin 5 isoform X1 [Mustela erminea]XP_032179912.1 sialic acid-binding Ig-like lectin 5 isoform X1 [Mustela erminea]XP_032179913.1 sialic acid-binding Ig-like lectin 5 isoform X1 [Mustela erminea]